MIINEFDQLATTPLRKNILTIAEAGYEAISIPHLIGKQLKFESGQLKINGHSYDLNTYKNVYVVGIGKGSGLICAELETLLGSDSIRGGVAIDLVEKSLQKIQVYAGTHPLPSEQNIEATKKLIKLLQDAKKDDLVLTIICGGGSSLACMPGKNLTCEDLQIVSDHLLKSGAKIQEINTIRKHMSDIHGGNLAKFAYPASVLGLVVSDVPGNNLEMVASGPISKDSTSLQEAKKIALKYSLGKLTLLETPKNEEYFKKVNIQLLADGRTAVEGMRVAARALGYRTQIFSDNLQIMASLVGQEMTQGLNANTALFACGETQVVVTNPGKGGRNQDVALATLPYLDSNTAIVSAASDGKDNIDVAGALVDGQSSQQTSKKLGINPALAVSENKSYNTLNRMDGIFHIQKITANVSDFIVVLRQG